MISDIVGALFWGAFFFATYPLWLIGASSAVHKHHVSGRGGYVRDTYLNVAPVMPGMIALYLAIGRTLNAQGDVRVWAVATAIAAAGAALFWAPPVQAARRRLKVAGQTAQTTWADAQAHPAEPSA